MDSEKIKFWRNIGLALVIGYSSLSFARWWLINKTWVGVAIATQVVRNTFNATEQFIQRYHSLPGDMRNAGSVLAGCRGKAGRDCNPFPARAGDGMIGREDFFKTLKPQVSKVTNVPAKSEADETVLFWTHLALSGFNRTNSDGMINGAEILFGGIYPSSVYPDTGFIVGYANDAGIPKELSPDSQPMSGTVLVFLSGAALRGESEMNDKGQLPFLPAQAASMDRHIDDGKPTTGLVQAYGSPDCFTTEPPSWAREAGYLYNETLQEKSCGLVFSLKWQSIDAKTLNGLK